MNKTASPKAVILGFSILLCVLTASATATVLSGHAIVLNENQILYLFSTSAQVIAAIYGLTLTGFIFFRNELSREESEDETLAEPVESLKARYFVLLVFITILVCFTLILANLAISYEGAGRNWITSLIINAGQSAFFTSLFAVTYFIFDVVAPKRIEQESKSLQSEVDPAVVGAAKGSLEEFLRNYNEIEAVLATAGENYSDKAVARSSYVRRISNTRLAEILFRNERIDKLLFAQLRELITLRNSIIHGADPVVSQAIVNTSADVLYRLKAALDENPDVETL